MITVDDGDMEAGWGRVRRGGLHFLHFSSSLLSLHRISLRLGPFFLFHFPSHATFMFTFTGS